MFGGSYRRLKHVSIDVSPKPIGLAPAGTTPLTVTPGRIWCPRIVSSDATMQEGGGGVTGAISSLEYRLRSLIFVGGVE